MSGRCTLVNLGARALVSIHMTSVHFLGMNQTLCENQQLVPVLLRIRNVGFTDGLVQLTNVVLVDAVLGDVRAGLVFNTQVIHDIQQTVAVRSRCVVEHFHGGRNVLGQAVPENRAIRVSRRKVRNVQHSLRLRVRSIASFAMFKRRIVSPALIWKSWAAWSASGAEDVGDAVVLVEVDEMESTAAIIVCGKCV